MAGKIIRIPGGRSRRVYDEETGRYFSVLQLRAVDAEIGMWPETTTGSRQGGFRTTGRPGVFLEGAAKVPVMAQGVIIGCCPLHQ